MFSEKNVSFICFIITIFSKIVCFFRRLSWASKLTSLQSKNIYLRWKVCKIKMRKRNVIVTSGSKYTSGLKVLNMASSQYATITQRPEYSSTCLDRVLNISRFLNKSGFWIWQGPEYARIIHGCKYALPWLNMRE